MSWNPRQDDQVYPPGYKEIMDRDGGLYNAWWQRGGNQLTEFIEKDHLYRSKYTKPPEWFVEPEFQVIDTKFSRLQRAKQKNWCKKIKRRKMVTSGAECGLMKTGHCSVLSDEENEDGGISKKKEKIKWGSSGWIGPNDGSPKRNNGVLAEELKQGGSSVSSSGIQSMREQEAKEKGQGPSQVSSTITDLENDERSSRLKSTMEAAAIRLANKTKGTKGTYKFGQEPFPEECIKRTERPEATAARSGSHRFNDNLIESEKTSLYNKDPLKPANAMSQNLKLAPGGPSQSSNFNDPDLINIQRESMGREKGRLETALKDACADVALAGSGGAGQGTHKKKSKSQKELGSKDSNSKVSKQQLSDNSGPLSLTNLRQQMQQNSEIIPGETGANSKSSQQLLPDRLDVEPWVKEDLGSKKKSKGPLTGSARMVADIKVPKHLRKKLPAASGPMMPYKSLQRLTTYSDFDYMLYRTDLHEDMHRSNIDTKDMYKKRHPYFRKGCQRSRFSNNSNCIAQVLHQGATENFPAWDQPYNTYPGFPFYGQCDDRQKDDTRKYVGEDTFLLWDKPLVSRPAKRQHDHGSKVSGSGGSKAQSSSKSNQNLAPILTDRTQPQKSNAFIDDPSSSAAEG